MAHEQAELTTTDATLGSIGAIVSIEQVNLPKFANRQSQNAAHAVQDDFGHARAD